MTFRCVKLAVRAINLITMSIIGLPSGGARKICAKLAPVAVFMLTDRRDSCRFQDDLKAEDLFPKAPRLHGTGAALMLKEYKNSMLHDTKIGLGLYAGRGFQKMHFGRILVVCFMQVYQP